MKNAHPIAAAGVIALTLVIGGCSSFSFHHTEAIREWNRAWDNVGGEYLEHTVTLEKVVVHVNGDNPCVKGAVGCASTANEIWVRGRMVDGRIVVDQFVLGHEIAHLLNWQDGAIANPDGIGK